MRLVTLGANGDVVVLLVANPAQCVVDPLRVFDLALFRPFNFIGLNLDSIEGRATRCIFNIGNPHNCVSIGELTRRIEFYVEAAPDSIRPAANG